jgi:hypothetical protein
LFPDSDDGIDDIGESHQLFELADAALVVRLGFFGGAVLGVFREIPVCPRFFNRSHDAVPLMLFALFELFLQRREPLLGHWVLVGHAGQSMPVTAQAMQAPKTQPILAKMTALMLTRITPSIRSLLLSVVVLTIITGTLHREVLFGNAIYHMDDAADNYYPARVAFLRAVREGTLPSWENGTMSGWPLLADPYYGYFYPLNVVFYLGARRGEPPSGDAAGVPSGLGYSAALHMWIGGLGMLWLLRRTNVVGGGAVWSGGVCAVVVSGRADSPHHLCASDGVAAVAAVVDRASLADEAAADVGGGGAVLGPAAPRRSALAAPFSCYCRRVLCGRAAAVVCAGRAFGTATALSADGADVAWGGGAVWVADRGDCALADAGAAAADGEGARYGLSLCVDVRVVGVEVLADAAHARHGRAG